MNGRVLKFVKTDHQAVEAVLPWFVNGTLGDAERHQVEEHLQNCVRCQREVEWLRAVHVSYADSDAALACEQSWRQLRMRLASAPTLWQRLLARLRYHKVPRRVQTWAPWVAALEFVLILVIGGVLVSDPDRSGRYRALAAASASAAASARLVVMFDSRSTAAETTRTLHQAGARIIDGPTATDAYVLSVPIERWARVVQQLRTEPAVVFVEPLDMLNRK